MFNNKGHSLVTLLVFILVAIAVTSTAMAVMVNTSQSTHIVEKRIVAVSMADSGVENAIIRLLRDPGYTGETLSVGDGTVVITVSGVSTQTITSTATVYNFTHTSEATVEYVDNRLTVTSWEPVY